MIDYHEEIIITTMNSNWHVFGMSEMVLNKINPVESLQYLIVGKCCLATK